MMRNLDELAERGLELAERKAGPDFAAQMRHMAASGGFMADVAVLGLHGFAETWGRPGWPDSMKSVAVVSALVAQGHPEELATHVKIGLANGLTAADFDALLTQLTPYVGLPAIGAAGRAIAAALTNAGVDLSPQVAP